MEENNNTIATIYAIFLLKINLKLIRLLDLCISLQTIFETEEDIKCHLKNKINESRLWDTE